MHQLLYVSQAARNIPASDLDDILVIGRANNMARNLSGILIHIDGGFLQIIEGARDSVMQVYGRIAEDSRHTHSRVLVDRGVAARSFPGWALGYEHLIVAKNERAGMLGIVRESDSRPSVTGARAAWWPPCWRHSTGWRWMRICRLRAKALPAPIVTAWKC